MSLSKSSKRHGFPVSIVSHAVWRYHRFNDSYKDIQKELAYRGIIISHETIRLWCLKFGRYFKDVIKKWERKPGDKWHLDEMILNINGVSFILWQAVDWEGYELDILLQKRRNKEAAIRFLSRLLGSYPAPRVIITDKLKSYIKPIRYMMPKSEHRSHKRLNKRIENSHQLTRLREKCLIKFKSPQDVQWMLSLMGKVRNTFCVALGRYLRPADHQRETFRAAKSIWDEAARAILCP